MENRFVFKKCPQCHKEFCEEEPGVWAYRRIWGHKRTDWCSYRCMREAEKEAEQKEEVKICPNCGKPVIGKRKKFCDIICRMDYHNRDEKPKPSSMLSPEGMA